MKKLFIGLFILLILASPYFLPMPIVTSGFVAQYALGESMTFDVAVWNVSPVTRNIQSEGATDIILKVDGKSVATTTTAVSPKITQFARTEQTVNYRISKKVVQTVGFDVATGELELPQGRHDIAVEWLGASSLPHNIAIVQV